MSATISASNTVSTPTPTSFFPPSLPTKLDMLTFIPLQTDEENSLESRVSAFGEIIDRDSQKHDMFTYYETINRDLNTLLLLPRDLFWSVAAHDPSLGLYIDSFLLNIRSYSVKGSPSSVAPSSLLGSDLRDFILAIREKTFKVLARLSLRQETSSMMMIPLATQGSILYDGLVVYPHAIFDICSVYGPLDFTRTQAIVSGIIASHPGYLDDISSAISASVESLVLQDRHVTTTLFPSAPKTVLPVQGQTAMDIPAPVPTTYSTDEFSITTVLADTLFSLHALLSVISEQVLPLGKWLADAQILPLLARLADHTLPSLALRFNCGYASFRGNPIFSPLYSYIIAIAKRVIEHGVLAPVLLTPYYIRLVGGLTEIEKLPATTKTSSLTPFKDSNSTPQHSAETLVKMVTPLDVKRVLTAFQSLCHPTKPIELPGERGNPTLVRLLGNLAKAGGVVGTEIGDLYDYEIEEKALAKATPENNLSGEGNSMSYSDFGSFVYFLGKEIGLSTPLRRILSAGNALAVSLPSTPHDVTLLNKLHDKIAKALTYSTVEQIANQLDDIQDDFFTGLQEVHKAAKVAGVLSDPFASSLSADTSASSATTLPSTWVKASDSLGNLPSVQKKDFLRLAALPKDQKIDRFVEEISSFRSFFPDYSTDFALEILETLRFDVNAAVNSVFEQTLPKHLHALTEAQRATYSSSTGSHTTTIPTSASLSAAGSSQDAEFEQQLKEFSLRTGRAIKGDVSTLSTSPSQTLNYYENEKERQQERTRLAAFAAAAAAAEELYDDDFDDALEEADFNPDFKAEQGAEHVLSTDASRVTKSTSGTAVNDENDDDDNDQFGPNKSRGGRVVGSKPKFKGSEDMSDRDKKYKNTNKSRFANHNRKDAAAKKNRV